MNKGIGFSGVLVMIGCLSLTISAASQAQESPDLECGTRNTNIYFGNGVWVQAGREMRLNLRALEGLVGTRLEQLYPDENFQFLEAYNPTRGHWRDLDEVYRQRDLGGSRPPLTTEQLNALLSLNQGEIERLRAQVASLESSTSGFESLVNLFTDDDALEVASEALDALEEVVSTLLIDQDLSLTNDTLTQLYRGNLDAGERVLIVSHSQGNLFALTSVESLISEDSQNASSLDVVGVATPADRTPNGAAYTTADDDRVIDGLRALYTVLPANIDNDISSGFSDPRDISNHTFVQSYLYSSLPSRQTIAANVLSSVASLAFPDVEAGEGALRATLVWGAEPDVDLHAFEPNGTHVYYANQNGPSGMLDVDDVSSFGPENYFVDCDTLELGQYLIGVNYYYGEGPETANLQLSVADGQVFSTSIDLAASRGSFGDSIPRILFQVDVSRNEETDAFVYEVVETDFEQFDPDIIDFGEDGIPFDEDERLIAE